MQLLSNKNSLLYELKIKDLEFLKNSQNILILQECKGPKARDCDIFSTNILVSLKIEANSLPKISLFECFLNSQYFEMIKGVKKNIGRSNTVKE